MRLFLTVALLLSTAVPTSHVDAQDLAQPSIDTQPIDVSARQSPWGRSDIDASRRDRVYVAGSSSTSISVVGPSNNMFLGVIPLDIGNEKPASSSGMPASYSPVLSYAPNDSILTVVSGSTGAVSFIDTRSNTVVHTARFDGTPASAAYAPNGKEVWVPVKGGKYVSILNAKGFAEVGRISTPGEPGMAIFSNNGRYAYVCSGTGDRTAVFDVKTRKVVGSVPEGGPSCPGIAASPDGKQIWLTSTHPGRAVAFSAKPPFEVLKVIETGPRTGNVNFVSNDDGQFAYVPVGGLNAVKVFDTRRFDLVSTIPVGASPRSVWPSGDGTKVYVALDSAEALSVIDAGTMKMVDVVKIGQTARSVAYVPYAARSHQGDENLRPAIDDGS